MNENRTNIKLKPVVKEDIEIVWEMQVEAFAELLKNIRILKQVLLRKE